MTVPEVARLLAERNAVDEKIARLIDRPALNGHIGEWIAQEVFDLDLETSASAKGIDGAFASGPLMGKTVNVKCYGKREGMLDTNGFAGLDYYLVLTGPKATSLTSKGGTRPFSITDVYLFDARWLTEQGVAVGVASSVRAALWEQSRIYPTDSPLLPLTDEQRSLLDLFNLQ